MIVRINTWLSELEDHIDVGVKRPAWVQCAGTGIRNVGDSGEGQVPSSGADIARGDGPVSHYLALYAEIPLLNVRCGRYDATVLLLANSEVAGSHWCARGNEIAQA